jgi:hypothetical protein
VVRSRAVGRLPDSSIAAIHCPSSRRFVFTMPTTVKEDGIYIFEGFAMIENALEHEFIALSALNCRNIVYMRIQPRQTTINSSQSANATWPLALSQELDRSHHIIA